MSGDASPPDSVAGWVARMPAGLRGYLRLIRADRPVGYWLLMWPCWWSVALARPLNDLAAVELLALFLVGAIVMRGAGCIWNDILDRDLDAQVARTAARPIASGAVSVARAGALMVALSLIGLAVLVQFNAFAIALGIASLALVAVYPLAKRVTDWPQAVLGLTFNWGALMGWAAVRGELAGPPVVLYLGCLAWTLGYDTIYAHQDRRDDAVVGVKSSALKLGTGTRHWLAVFYGVFLAGLAGAGALAGLSPIFYIALLPAAGHLAWQLRRLDIETPERCLALFRSNAQLGWLVFAAFALGQIRL